MTSVSAVAGKSDPTSFYAGHNGYCVRVLLLVETGRRMNMQ